MTQQLKYEYYLQIWGATVQHFEEFGFLPKEASHEFYFSTKAEVESFKKIILALESFLKASHKDRLFGLVMHEAQGPQVRFRPVLNAIVLYKGEYIYVTKDWTFPKDENDDDSHWEYVLEYKFDIGRILGDVDDEEFSIIQTFMTFKYVPDA